MLVRSADESRFKIIISDDGKGFDIKQALKMKRHFGLKNIQTRAEALQGELAVISDAGEGTQVTLTVPY